MQDTYCLKITQNVSVDLYFPDKTCFFLHIFSFRSMGAVAMYTMGLTIATARGGGRGRVIMFSCSSQRSGFYHACTFDSGVSFWLSLKT